MWLAKNQAADGSWGKRYTLAVTSFACLAQLAAADEPFEGDSVPPGRGGIEVPECVNQHHDPVIISRVGMVPHTGIRRLRAVSPHA